MAGSVPWTEDDLADGRRRAGRADGLGPEAGPRRWSTVALAAAGLLAAAVAGGGVVYLITGGKDAEVAGPPPLIKAEERPIKVAPDVPGGMEVPNRDKMIYSRLKGEDEQREVERLLPQPEQPQLPPSAKLDELVRSDETKAPTLLLPPDDGAVAGQLATDPRLPPSVALPAEVSPPVQPAPPAEPPAPPVKKEQVAVARPVPSAPSAKPSAKAAPEKPGATAATGRFQVQLLAARSEQDAKAAWQRLQSKNGDVLAGLTYSVQRADLGAQGIFYRLRAGPIADEAKAKSICSTLSGRNVSCLIIKPKR